VAGVPVPPTDPPPADGDTNRRALAVLAYLRSDPTQAADLVVAVLADPARRRMFAIARPRNPNRPTVQTNRGDS